VLRKQTLDRDTTFESPVPGGNCLDHLGHPTASDGPDETITLGRVHAPNVNANLCGKRF